MRQQRSAECASDMRFDASLAGELPAPAQETLRAHVAGCSRCSVRQKQMIDARLKFAASASGALPAFLRRERAARPARRWRVGGIALCFAACAALAFLLPRPEPSGERVKGGEHVSFFVKRGDAVRRGARKQRVQPGDKLRFTYTALTPRYLAIVSIDAADQVSVYYPAERGSTRAAPIQPGVEVPLPSAVELDGVLGEERVFALFCEAAQELAPLRLQLLTTPHTLRAPPRCSLDELILTKEAKTP